jgi:alpha-glucosidase
VRLAKFCIELLVSLRGSICLYQGEELGLTEAELEFADLRDPYGIRFWPAFKGRDGCRTPMVWEGRKKNGGFSAGKPWLPVPPAHLDHAVDRQERDGASVLAHYRAMLAFRREHPALVTGRIEFLDAPDNVLAILRSRGKQRLLCLFNFANKSVNWKMPSRLGTLHALHGAGTAAASGVVRLAGLSSSFAALA